MSFDVGFVVHEERIKTVKDFLKARGFLHKSLKIQPYLSENNEPDPQSKSAVIPVKQDAYLEVEALERALEQDVKDVLNTIVGADAALFLQNDIVNVVPVDHENRPNGKRTQNALHQAVWKALVESHVTTSHEETVPLLSVLPKSYSIYEPMLLLPSHIFANERWLPVLSYMEANPQQRIRFFAAFAQEIGVTHIAINAPIPAQKTANSCSHDGDIIMEENLLRSPTNLQPVYGDFGPALAAFPSHMPTSKDFREALWVSTRQNGITQVWAPRYTMFSSGNVTEKARVLRMPSVQSAVDEGRKSGKGCSAVDLFAGIGYFAFSYAKAGVSKVICWDLNPWSVEGFRRGAAANRWSFRIVTTEQLATEHNNDDSKFNLIGQGDPETFLIFSESNEYADDRITLLRSGIPPIRHVNCGMLPSIGYAWKTAVQALDPLLGGWLHLHETVAENEIQRRAESFKEMIFDYYGQLHQAGARERSAIVSVEHIEHVKSIGPRLWHIVVDIYIRPEINPETER